MVALRKLFLVLAVMSFLVGMASAQTTMNCTYLIENPRLIRPEGITELVGDIRLDCSGTGSSVNVNIVAQFTSVVTSRELNSQLEAVLIHGATVVHGVETAPTQISFNNVAFAPPGTTYTIKNIRVLAPPAGGVVQAFVSIVQAVGSGPVIPTVTPSAFLPVATVSAAGLDVEVDDTEDALQCEDLNEDQADDSTEDTAMSRAFRVVFSEPAGFPNYLKVRSVAGVAAINEEDATTSDDMAGIMQDGGKASHGTRLMVRVSDVPAGVKVFISQTIGSGIAELLLPGLVDANCANLFPAIGGAIFAPETNAGGSIADGASANTVELVPVNGVATACYEITSAASGSTVDELSANVHLAYLAGVPPKGAVIMAKGSIAPLSTSSSTEGFDVPIPRFSEIGTPEDVFDINACQTILLFPFVSNIPGFDTGLAISNTSADSPVDAGISPQDGDCTLYFFGDMVVPPATASVDAGTTVTWLLSNVGPGFTGYIYADCSFEGAHGYAFLSDLGAQKLAQGYLALVVSGDGLDQ